MSLHLLDEYIYMGICIKIIYNLLYLNADLKAKYSQKPKLDLPDFCCGGYWIYEPFHFAYSGKDARSSS